MSIACIISVIVFACFTTLSLIHVDDEDVLVRITSSIGGISVCTASIFGVLWIYDDHPLNAIGVTAIVFGVIAGILLITFFWLMSFDDFDSKSITCGILCIVLAMLSGALIASSACQTVPCKKCGQSVGITDTYCSYCGADNRHVNTNQCRRCPLCNANVDHANTYCPRCGTAIEQVVCCSCNNKNKTHNEGIYCSKCGKPYSENNNYVENGKCPACYQSVEAEDVFCKYCGTVIKDQNNDNNTKQGADGKQCQQSQETRCPVCKQNVDKDDAYCKHCGASIDNPLCPVCKQSIDEDDVYCKHCGAVLAKEASS